RGVVDRKRLRASRPSPQTRLRRPVRAREADRRRRRKRAWDPPVCRSPQHPRARGLHTPRHERRALSGVRVDEVKVVNANDVRSLAASLDLSRPRVTYDGPAPIRDSSELFSAAEPWLKRGGSILDLGCGPRDQAVAAGHYRLRYVGVDFDSPAADLRVDAHA